MCSQVLSVSSSTPPDGSCQVAVTEESQDPGTGNEGVLCVEEDLVTDIAVAQRDGLGVPRLLCGGRTPQPCHSVREDAAQLLRVRSEHMGVLRQPDASADRMVEVLWPAHPGTASGLQHPLDRVGPDISGRILPAPAAFPCIDVEHRLITVTIPHGDQIFISTRSPSKGLGQQLRQNGSYRNVHRHAEPVADRKLPSNCPRTLPSFSFSA
jgi:hypothetical protein